MLVSFIVVAYNAVGKIDDLFDDLLGQDYDKKKIEVLLVDSVSPDNTKAVMQSFKGENDGVFSSISILDNPKKILPCGWNIALKETTGDVILRVDAHARIPEDFISKNVDLMEQGEKITGGPRTSKADDSNSWQTTLLVAESSMFGSGIAKYRHGEEGCKQYVTTLAHATYSREVFEAVGGYDERLARTEDNEIHYRMRQAGYKFCFDPKVHSFHFVRSSLSKMVQQKYKNGYWIGLTMGISPHCFSIYHFIPFAFVVAILSTIVLAIVDMPLVAIVLWLAYILANFIMSIVAIVSNKFKATHLLLPFIFLLLHVSYGVGTLVGLIKLPFWRSKTENQTSNEIEIVKMTIKNKSIMV